MCVEVLKWVRSNGFPWNKDACSSTSQNGYILVMKYLTIDIYKCLNVLDQIIFRGMKYI